MNILIDTHIALWSMYDDQKLSEKAVQYLTDENNAIFVSLVSAWEIAIKSSLGKLSVPAKEFMRDCDAMGYRELTVSRQHIIRTQEMPQGPQGHKDPFDRLLLAQAEVEGYRFLTEDGKILQYQSPVIL